MLSKELAAMKKKDRAIGSDVIGYRLSRSRTEISALNRLGWLPALAVSIYTTMKILCQNGLQ